MQTSMALGASPIALVSSAEKARLLGWGKDPDGLTRAAALDITQKVSQTSEVVALTVAEYVPRQAIAMQQLLSKLPLLGS